MFSHCSSGCGTGTQRQSDHQPFPNLQHDGRRLRGVAELPDGFHQREAMDRDDIRRRRTHQLYFQYHAENLQRNGQFIYWVDTGAEYTSGVTAVIAYYAYLIIGMDMDTMAPLGGSDILQMAMDVANNSQNLGYAGWKAFENDRNRFAIINDYLDGAMEPLRQLEYKYHRLGLDRMTENTDTARMAITESIEMLKQARDQKSMSALPVIFTDIKRDELVSIYSGKGTAEEREKVYNIVFAINASQSNYWEKLRK